MTILPPPRRPKFDQHALALKGAIFCACLVLLVFSLWVILP